MIWPSVAAPPAVKPSGFGSTPPGAESQDDPRLPRRGSFPSCPGRAGRLLLRLEMLSFGQAEELAETGDGEDTAERRARVDHQVADVALRGGAITIDQGA